MAITKMEFQTAFREVMSKEFENIPKLEEEIDYIFSERFIKKMEQLIKSKEKIYWNFVNTASKRVAIVFLALLIPMCSVRAIREPMVEMLRKNHKESTDYKFEGDTVDAILKEYQIQQLPEGFELVDKREGVNTVIHTYENGLGEVIDFAQRTSTKTTMAFDFDQEKKYTSHIGSVDVDFYIYQEKNVIGASWTQNSYVFEIRCCGNIDVETLEQLILSVK